MAKVFSNEIYTTGGRIISPIVSNYILSTNEVLDDYINILLLDISIMICILDYSIIELENYVNLFSKMGKMEATL